jgi:hypothetical protein
MTPEEAVEEYLSRVNCPESVLLKKLFCKVRDTERELVKNEIAAKIMSVVVPAGIESFDLRLMLMLHAVGRNYCERCRCVYVAGKDHRCA